MAVLRPRQNIQKGEGLDGEVERQVEAGIAVECEGADPGAKHKVP
jgi:hypothetical protein